MAAAVLFVAAAVAYVASGGEPAGNGDSGAFFPSCNLWMPAGVAQMLLNVACVVAAGYLLKYLNRLHGFIRGGNAAIMLSAFLMPNMPNTHSVLLDNSHTNGEAMTESTYMGRDTVSEITGLEAVWEGDLFWKAPQSSEAAWVTLRGRTL